MGVMLQIARVPETLTVREHVHLFSSVLSAPAAAGRRVLELAGLDVGRGSAVRQPVGRPEAAGAVRAGHLRQPGAALPRRAHRRAWTSRRAGCSGRPCVTSPRRAASILLTTHYLEEADALANRVVVINRGRIIADGRPDQIKAHAAGRQITCRSRLTHEALSALPGVTRVDDAGRRRAPDRPPMPRPRRARCCCRTRPWRDSRFAAPDSKRHSSRSPTRIRPTASVA